MTLEQLRAEPGGIRVPLTTRHQKYAELNGGGPRGFRTPSRKIELYSEVLLDHGYPPLPEFEEPRTSPISRPDLAEQFPLILTCTKSLWFCETQHRNVASLRSRVPDPQVVCGQHGWWQACAELGLPDYPPFGPGSANLNLVLRQGPSDPISGSSPLRASVCNIAPPAASEPGFPRLPRGGP